MIRFGPLRTADLAELFDECPEILALKGSKIGGYRLAMNHVARTRCAGFYAGPRLVAASGLYPESPTRLELWFACRPEASRHMLAIVRAGRLTLSQITETEGVEIFARVAPGWEPGERLARAVGLARDPERSGQWRRGI